MRPLAPAMKPENSKTRCFLVESLLLIPLGIRSKDCQAQTKEYNLKLRSIQ